MSENTAREIIKKAIAQARYRKIVSPNAYGLYESQIIDNTLAQLRSLLPEKRKISIVKDIPTMIDEGWNAYHDEMMRRLT